MNVDPNININGMDLYMESFSATEPVQRREVKRTSLMNGTEFIQAGAFIPRQFTFNAHLKVPIDRPDAYDEVLTEICNGVCDIVSLDMGSFKGEVTFQKTHDSGSPEWITLAFTVKEIAEKSSIPGDEVITPATEVVIDNDSSSE